jgi:exodeoxyribonuclease-3
VSVSAQDTFSAGRGVLPRQQDAKNRAAGRIGRDFGGGVAQIAQPLDGWAIQPPNVRKRRVGGKETSGAARAFSREPAPGTRPADNRRMKIATYNVNGVNGRLPRLLEWLAETAPDVACLQELKTSDATFPEAALREAGYGAVWTGQKSFNGVAILARGAAPVLRRSGLPGDPDDTHSRYIEAEVRGVVVASIYLPNGNPQPGPKFVYKLAWFERLIVHAAELLATNLPVVLAGDYNVVPTDADIYSPKSWLKDALLQPESRDAYRRLLAQGWTDAIRARHPDEAIYTFWDYMRNRWPRNAGLRIDHLLLSPALAPRLLDANVDREQRGKEKASDHAPAWVVLQDQVEVPRRPARAR